MYSQNNEEEIILKYFVDFTGNLLDIGANDGETLSNSRALILKGWNGVLVEPSPSAYQKLKILYGATAPNVYIRNVAIMPESFQGYETTLHESGEHLGKGDTALLSSIHEAETKRWKKETFTPVTVPAGPYDMEDYRFDFITIDAEGMDWEILKQIDLTHTRMVCIEWNQQEKLKWDYVIYCGRFGLSLHAETYENLIFAR